MLRSRRCPSHAYTTGVAPIQRGLARPGIFSHRMRVAHKLFLLAAEAGDIAAMDGLASIGARPNAPAHRFMDGAAWADRLGDLRDA